MATKTKQPTHVFIQVYSEESLITVIPFNKNDVSSMLKLAEYVNIETEMRNEYNGEMMSVVMGAKEMFDEIQEAARLDNEHHNLILTMNEYTKIPSKGKTFVFDTAEKYRT